MTLIIKQKVFTSRNKEIAKNLCFKENFFTKNLQHLILICLQKLKMSKKLEKVIKNKEF